MISRTSPEAHTLTVLRQVPREKWPSLFCVQKMNMFLEVLDINLREKPKAQKTHTGVLSVKQQNSV